MKIVRFASGDEPRYGIVTTSEEGHEQIEVAAGDPLFGELRTTGRVVALDDVRLLAPVIPRSKVVGIGRNYVDHAQEMGSDVPTEPLMFLIPNTAVVGPDDPIVLPDFSDEVHYEGELAVVIGKLCKNVPVEHALDVVAGYTCANDVTARDAQRGDGQWARAKGFDSACPLGPYLVSDLDPDALDITVRRDGEVVQSGNTRDMVFGVADLIARVSAAFTLLPGDIILTGTPAGVGPIVEGNVVEVEIEELGVLRNPVVRR